MSFRGRIIVGVLMVLEEMYLESASDEAKEEYAELSDPEKRKCLKAYLQENAGKTKEWAKVILDRL
jgi:hypothetical protein